MLPEHLVGQTHRGGYICPEWELRITARCLGKAFTSDRFDRSTDTRKLSQVRTGVEVWVLSRGHDHRGATAHDPDDHVVWLLAYARHRSGAPDDFFPHCRELADAGELLPTTEDHERLIRDRDRRFVEMLPVEAAYILDEARRTGAEQRVTLGGSLGGQVAVELDEELGAEAITVAICLKTLLWDHLTIILAAFEPTEAWASIDHLPSRALDPDEMAWTVTRELE